MDHEVHEASDGKTGLKLATAHNPDLILLDIKMPVMGGLSMLKELRKSKSGKIAKVIVLTNLEPDDKIIKKVIEDRPQMYLVKSDIELSELMKQIKEIVGSD